MSKPLALRIRVTMLFVFVAALLITFKPQRKAADRLWAQSETAELEKGGYVLAADEGEVLQRPGGQIVIKADPRTGSGRLAVGTQQLYLGSGIRLHQHQSEDEVLWIQEGSGTAIIGNTRKEVKKGAFVYVPQGVWHGLENPQGEVRLVWIVSPPGLENFFREVGTAPGIKPKSLTPDQLNDIARKHGTRFKIE